MRQQPAFSIIWINRYNGQMDGQMEFFFFFGNQEGSKNTKWNLFKNHPIHLLSYALDMMRANESKSSMYTMTDNGRTILQRDRSHRTCQSWVWQKWKTEIRIAREENLIKKTKSRNGCRGCGGVHLTGGDRVHRSLCPQARAFDILCMKIGSTTSV